MQKLAGPALNHTNHQPHWPGHRQFVVAVDVGNHADVCVLANSVGTQSTQQAVFQKGGIKNSLVTHHLHAKTQALKMLAEAKDIELLVFSIPISSQTLKHAKPVFDNRRKSMDFCFAVRNDIAVQTHEIAGAHRINPPGLIPRAVTFRSRITMLGS